MEFVMAGIDKIYGTQEQYKELRAFLVKRHRYALKYLWPEDCYTPGETRVISNFPVKVDMWLLKYCKIPWVIEAIKEQYGMEGDS
jgi:hypothetical protein